MFVFHLTEILCSFGFALFDSIFVGINCINNKTDSNEMDRNSINICNVCDSEWSVCVSFIVTTYSRTQPSVIRQNQWHRKKSEFYEWFFFEN